MKRFRVVISGLCILGISLIACSTQKQEKILLKGDLHCHSMYSHDGFYSIEEVATYAKEAGFDFISITDHNTKNHFRDPYVDDELIMIPGYELTLQRGVGHLNLFGEKDIKESLSMLKIEQIEEYAADYHEKGGKLQINHPFNPTYYWGLGFDFDYDYLELWNGTFDSEEFEGLEWWQNTLVNNKKVIATGGTDSHKSKAERYPVNCVWVDEASEEGILQALDKGNLYVTKNAQGPHIKLYSGDYIMGDIIPKNNKEIQLDITALQSGNIIKIYTDKGLEKEEVASSENYSLEIPVEDRLFYRVEIWQDSESMLAFSNPIYIEQE